MKIELKKEEDIQGTVTFVYYEDGFPKKTFDSQHEDLSILYFKSCKKRLQDGFPKSEILLTETI